MATLATILRKFETAGAQPRRVGMARPNPYQLRALPNEDIFFYTKRVDNSRLVREADPRAKAECWSTIGAVCALAAVLLTSLAPTVPGITAGDQIPAPKQERPSPLRQPRGLPSEPSARSRPERLAGMCQ